MMSDFHEFGPMYMPVFLGTQRKTDGRWGAGGQGGGRERKKGRDVESM
jgi:hypothetical protein